MKKQRCGLFAMSLSLALVFSSFAGHGLEVTAAESGIEAQADSSISGNNPGTDTDDPGDSTTSGNNPGTGTEQPGTDAEKPGTDTEQPGTDTEQPGTDAEKPGENDPDSDQNKPNTTVDDLKGTMGDALADPAKTDEAVQMLADTDIAVVQSAIQNDAAFLSLVEQLETNYAEAKGIKTSQNVSTEAAKVVDTNKVKVVGMALNVSGGQVSLNMSVASDKKSLGAGYGNSVQLDISMFVGTSSITNLNVPVTITMPVPKGIDSARLVILHYHGDASSETGYRRNSDGTITMTVTGFSTFVFAEREAAEENDGGSWSDDLDSLAENIRTAASNATITCRGINTLSNSVMKQLLARGDVTLVMEYTYQGKDYRVVIPAGKAVNNDIPWYGPLYLAGYYGSSVVKGGITGDYIVKKGDTLGAIARAAGMSVSQVAALNPQIKDVNLIYVGQKIKLH